MLGRRGAVADKDIARAGALLFADGQQRFAHLENGAGLAVQGDDEAGVRAGQIDAGLGGPYGHHDLVDVYLIAGRDMPLDHLGLGQTLTEVGQHERPAVS